MRSSPGILVAALGLVLPPAAMTMEAVQSPERMSQEKPRGETNEAGSVPGLGGLIGKSLARKKPEESGRRNRATVFTSQTEIPRATPDVASGDAAIPAGFKQSK